MKKPAVIAGIPIPRRVLDMRDRAHGLIDARNRAAAARRATEGEQEATPRLASTSAVFDGLERPALQGLACQYDTPFADNEGRLLVLQSGALAKSLHDGRRKRLLVDHDDELEVGDTKAGLEFDSNGAFGLAMRFPLTNSGVHARLAELVRDGKRACLSIGGAIVKSKTKTIAGHDVEFVSEFRLDEVSVCFQGANTPAFVGLVDLAREPKALATAARESSFQTKVSVARAVQTTRRISERLAEAPSGALGTKPKPVRRRGYTVADSNRWETERKEALQTAARRPRW